MKRYILICTLISLLFSCVNENELPQKWTTDTPPGFNDEDISWVGISGGVIIKYTMPVLENPRGIEARYKLETGVEIVARGSFLSDSLIVEGYQTTSEKIIELYVIDNSDNYSDPYILKVTPKVSALEAVQESLEVIPDFGGMQIRFKNQDRKAIATFISRVNKDSIGNIIDTTLIEQYYTDQVAPLITIRGQDAKESEYIFQFRDRWDNYTEELSYKITPLFEKYVDNFDYMDADYFGGIENISSMYLWFDGTRSVTGWGNIFWPDAGTSKQVHWSSIKFDNPTTLSRILLWQYAWGGNNYMQLYAGQNVRKMDIYGTLEDNPAAGDPATNPSWIHIMECEIKMPSGGTYNSDPTTLPEEDFDVARNRGHEFIIPLQDPMPQYKALSFRVKESFQGGTSPGLLAEIELYGDDRAEGEN